MRMRTKNTPGRGSGANRYLWQKEKSAAGEAGVERGGDPEEDAGSENGSEDGDEEEHCGRVADELHREEASDEGSGNADDDVEDEHSGLRGYALRDKCCGYSYECPDEPYEYPGVFGSDNHITFHIISAYGVNDIGGEECGDVGVAREVGECEPDDEEYYQEHCSNGYPYGGAVFAF